MTINHTVMSNNDPWDEDDNYEICDDCGRWYDITVGCDCHNEDEPF